MAMKLEGRSNRVIVPVTPIKMKKINVNGETFYKDRIAEVIKYSNWSPRAFVLGVASGIILTCIMLWGFYFSILL